MGFPGCAEAISGSRTANDHCCIINQSCKNGNRLCCTLALVHVGGVFSALWLPHERAELAPPRSHSCSSNGTTYVACHHTHGVTHVLVALIGPSDAPRRCSSCACRGSSLNASATTGVPERLEEEAHKVNPEIKSGPSLTLKSLKEVADCVKSLLVAEKRAGGVNFMGYVLN